MTGPNLKRPTEIFSVARLTNPALVAVYIYSFKHNYIINLLFIYNF